NLLVFHMANLVFLMGIAMLPMDQVYVLPFLVETRLFVQSRTVLESMFLLRTKSLV
ncbi:hypothetical protein HDU99_007796, partial [Rhizoclosmatium hyalinum]